MVKAKFLRRGWTRYAKLGRGVKKNQKWRRPTGRDNKMRESRAGKPALVAIGYGVKDKKEIQLIKNVQDLEKMDKKKIIVLGHVGKKNKLEIVKKAKEKGIKFSNLNIGKFLKKTERKTKEKKK